MGLDNLVNTNLLFLNNDIGLFFHLVAEFEQALTGHATEDAAIIDGSVSLDLSVPILEDKEHIQNGHLLHEVVQQPKHVVESIALGL